MAIIYNFFNSYEKILIIYLFIANSSYLLLLFLGYINSRIHYSYSAIDTLEHLSQVRQLIGISILVPCYNEEASIIESLKSVFKIKYTEFEIVVCNDGSKDNTINILKKEFKLKPVNIEKPKYLPSKPIKTIYKSALYANLTVIDKENGGKADALNAAINYSIYPLICCVDSDSILDEKGLEQISREFFNDPDYLVAVGGTVRVANGSEIEYGKIKKPLIKWDYFSMVQIVEYIRAFLVGRMGWDFLKCNTIISGAFGVFKKEKVIAIGGYSTRTIGEDLELLLRIHQKSLYQKEKYRVLFLPDPICWTEVPTDFKTLGNQRSRWQQGLAEGLWLTKQLLFKPYSGRIGWFALPYLWLFELISAPLELLGYLVMITGLIIGFIDFKLALLFLTVSIVFGWLLSFGGILIEESTYTKYEKISDLFKLFIATILEQLGFRQLHLYWRLRGIWRWWRGNTSWGEMKRKGMNSLKG